MSKRITLILGISVLILSSCGTNNKTASDTAAIQNDVSSISAQSIHNPEMLSVPVDSNLAGPDDELAAIAQKYPAFGGYYVNDSNELVIMVAKHFNKLPIGEAPRGRAVGLIRKAVLDYVGDANSPITPEGERPMKIRDLKVKIVDSDNSFADLQSWRLHLRHMMHDFSISELSIDRINGKINASTFTDKDKAKLIQAATEMGIPTESLNVDVGMAGKTGSSLINTVRPPAAALEVRSKEGCTIGANVTNGTTSGFLTAGHCSQQEGVTESSVFYQGRDSNNNPQSYQIGTESAEPGWLPPDTCTSLTSTKNTLCKDQDVTFVAYSVPADRGSMYKTTETTYSTTINTTSSGANDTYSVNAFYGSGETANLLNQTLNNVGARTGYKQAKVVSVDSEINYGNDVLIHAVKLYSLDGNAITCSSDSGGPWFSRTGVVNGVNTAKLAGIQAGGGNLISPTPTRFATLLPGEGGSIRCYQSAFMTPVSTILKHLPYLSFTR